jgi:hypothetical protein
MTEHKILPGRRARAVVVTAALAAVVVVAASVGALAANRFGDVSSGHTHAAGIGWVADAGITLGCGDGSDYCPNDEVSRDQMATFMHRLSGNAPGTAPSVNAATVQGKTARDLQGQRGPAGPKGEPGEDGTIGLEYGYAEVEVEDDLVAVFAACPAGKEPIGGGGGVDTPGWFLFLDAPWYDEQEDVAGWLIAAEHVDGEIQEVGAFAVAACALPDPDAAEGFEAQSSSGESELRGLQERYARSRLDAR